VRGRTVDLSLLALLGVATTLAGCGYEDRSPKPVGDWRQIYETHTPSGIEISVWETDSNKDGRTCMSVDVDPAPAFPLERPDPALYKGRDPACARVPTTEDPLRQLRFSESDRYGLLIVGTPEDTTAALELRGGKQVENLAERDTSSSLNLYVGVYDSDERASVLRLEGPEGAIVCRFDVESPGFDPSCRSAQ
jgi:hypothetical protein